jgi:hypothetical protein
MIITLQLQGDTVHVVLTRDENEYCDRVKVYAPRSTLVLDEKNKRLNGTVTLAQGATMRIDAYGPEGEGQLLSQEFRHDETGLVPEKAYIDDIQVVIAEVEHMAAVQLSKRAKAEVDQRGLHLSLLMQSGEGSEPTMRTLDFSIAEAYTLFGLLQNHIEMIEQLHNERFIKRHEESE